MPAMTAFAASTFMTYPIVPALDVQRTADQPRAGLHRAQPQPGRWHGQIDSDAVIFNGKNDASFDVEQIDVNVGRLPMADGVVDRLLGDAIQMNRRDRVIE